MRIFILGFVGIVPAILAACPPGYYLSGSTCVSCNAGTYKDVAGDSISLCITCPAGFECPSTLNAIPCGSGSYSPSGSTSCLKCPAGYECVSTGVNPGICPAGTYSTGGQTSCTECPLGFYQTSPGHTSCLLCPGGSACASRASGPVACVAGRFSLDGSTFCGQCSPGSYQPSPGQSSCLPCPAGSFCGVAASSATPCDPGFFSGGGASQCSLCPPYTRSRVSRDGCDPCPAGYECPVDPRGATSACAYGTWSPAGNEGSCIACPAGAYCSDPTLSPRACPAGYSLGGAATCTTCPAGSQCPTTSQSPSACASGTYSTANSTSCITCPAGFSCANAAATPVACLAGQYSLEGATACTPCVAGEACVASNRPPQPCPAGWYATAGSTSCTECPAGHICPSTALGPVACPSGTFALAGYTTCTQCPAGSRCSSTSALPTPCAAGTYSPAGSTSCIDCPAGFYCPNNLNAAPIPCDPGTYAASGSRVCTRCPAGFACPDTTQATQIACTSGTYSLGGSTACITCPAGYRCPTTSAAPTQCTPGSYADAGETSCTNCAAGSACPRTDSSAAIVLCVAGEYALSQFVRCLDCPAGHACPTTTATPVVCALGFFSTGRATSCDPCPAGFECASATSSVKYPCTPGTYAPLRIAASSGATATLSCTPCPAGSYCSDSAILGSCSPGSYSLLGSGVCTMCPAGYSCQTNAAPVICPAGTWSAMSATTCTACSPGYLCPVGSTSSTPTGAECPMGGHCPDGVTFVPCTAGTRGYRVGATSAVDGCEPCPEGYYCPTGSTRETSRLCPPGYFCPLGSATPANCPAGTFNPLAGAVGPQATSCRTCPAGYYCPSASSDANNLCPPGYFCPTGSSTYTSSPAGACPAGRYGGAARYGLTAQSDCYNCTVGSYCTGTGSPDPTPCAAGRYNPTQGGVSSTGSCMICPAGWACPNTGTAILSERCAQGYFCPQGTTNRFANACPQGRYSDRNDLTASTGCTLCPERYTCPAGTGGLNLAQPCAIGYYCPAGTGQNIAGNRVATLLGGSCLLNAGGYSNLCGCPPGSYGTSTQLAAAAECTVCPPGFWCAGALGGVSGSCRPGYYCPSGSIQDDQVACPAGTYSTATNNSIPEHCTDCPTGSYCLAAATAPTVCLAGTYTNITRTPSQAACRECPAGFRCSAGASAPIECGVGYHSDPNSSSCTICPRGHYCPSNSTASSSLSNSVCEAGTFCDYGRSTPPDFTNNACPAGYYCPAGTTNPLGCPAGYYYPFKGAKALADCILCPAGSYCVADSSSITGTCRPGFVCPAGSSVENTTACVVTTYRNASGGRDPSDCSLCPSGFFCGLATSQPQDCPIGSYCPVGSGAPIPCTIGTFSNVTNVRRVEDCAPCLPGYFCNSPGLTSPAGLCDAGYYCLAGSNTSAPAPPGDPFSSVPLPIGGRCPAGGYCPQGSSYPLPCDPGTFGNTTGAQDKTACVSCLPGYYCSGSSSPFPTGKCPAGYYCLGGSKTGTETPAPPGTYAVEGSVNVTLCPPGTRNPSYGASFCRFCDPGRLCNLAGMSFSDFECPAGSYCPVGSATAQPCPNGTYRAIPGGANVTDCNACDVGAYCGQTGLTEPSGPCAPGYYCLRGSAVATPGFDGQNVTVGGVCPRGFYCISGTSDPVRCPLGTYNPSFGGSALSSCLSCPAGYFCGLTALTAPSGPCDPGFYCTGGASISTQFDCPVGAFCNGTNTSPIGCPVGTFNNVTRQSRCAECTARHFCDGTTPSTPQPCRQGYYCPTGTGTNLQACPIGRFSNRTGLMDATECDQCPAGWFCGSTALQQPTALCQAGFVCIGGAIDSFGRTLAAGPVSLCPQGSWCAEGTIVPAKCPLGTYSNATGLTALGNCTLCDGGWYCGATGLITPTGPCAAGYYCTLGNSIATPTGGVVNVSYSVGGIGATTVSVGGGTCHVGGYCPVGSDRPTSCPNGTFNNATGLGSLCPPCPAGFWCGVGFSTYLFSKCPLGYYCPEGTRFATEFPCPVGRFGHVDGLRSSAECNACPAGEYCAQVALIAPSGNCSAGYVCYGAATSPTPNDNTTGTRCVAGQYCPAGTKSIIACPPGFFCTDPTSGAVDGECDAGYYCVQGAPSPRPTGQVNGYGLIGDVCPRGAYCEQGSQIPQLCSAGTYNNATGATSTSFCLPCLSGYFCDTAGLSTPVKRCSPGYYCPSGTISPTLACTMGHMCSGGDATPAPCPAGTFNNLTGKASCATCPASFYCPASTINPLVCPAGFFCWQGAETGREQPCPTGTYSNVTGLANFTQCTRCEPGYYCAGVGNTSPTGQCSAGHYCLGGANSSTPTEGFARGYVCSTVEGYGLGCAAYFNATANVTVAESDLYVAISPPAPLTGDLCPAGHYCPAGSPSPSRCPAGTFTNATGGSSLASCLACSAGYLCPHSAMTAPSMPCPEGQYCPGGNAASGLPCVAGHFCPAGAPAPTPCAPGYFQSSNGSSTCNSCTEGGVCASLGTVSPTACPPGHYCPLGTQSPMQYPCPPGTFSNATSLSNSSQCKPCSAGAYCATSGLTTPTGHCSPGYICLSGSSVPTPTDGIVGYSCPTGAFCPAGAVTGQLCPPGTFNNATNRLSLVDCLPCTSGYTCPDSGTVQPSRLCDAGYVCPGGDATAVVECALGHFCPEGSRSPWPCPAGTYQNQTGRSTCTSCPVGHYCEAQTAIPAVCTAGSYCPLNTTFATEFLCPPGTFSNRTGLAAVDDCTSCSPGMFCAQAGLTAPSGLCTAGFYCVSGSNTSQPTYGSDRGYVCSTVSREFDPSVLVGAGDICPPAHYCPAGSSAPKRCPVGTFFNGTGAITHTDCTTCTPGFICPSLALTAPSLPCPAGFVCYGGNVNGTETPCPLGNECPTGSAVSTPCSPGFYADEMGLSHCKPCSARSFCLLGQILPADCPPGYYCPALTPAAHVYPCPIGSYSPIANLADVSECSPCTGGRFCNSGGLSAPSGNCSAGYYCASAAQTDSPVDGVTGNICPLGHYCPSGIATPLACPPGTFANTTAVSSLSGCLPCLAGYTCPQTATVTPWRLCDAGFVCPQGTAVASSLCPTGAACSEGSASPQPCHAGTFQNRTGQSTCVPCPSGHFCDAGAVQPLPCPPGSFCPHNSSSTTILPCPSGRFSSLQRLSEASQCAACTPGRFCASSGLTAPSGNCSAGFYCIVGSNSSSPTQGFSQGYICSAAVGYGLGCPAYYNSTDNRTYSASGNLVALPAMPTMGDVCPPGHYCSAGSSFPAPCPASTWRNTTAGEKLSDCFPCLPRYLCPSSGLAYPLRLCDAGFYCPGGQATVGISCPRGFFCVAGVSQPTPCSAGTYQDVLSQSSCKVCPVGFFCVNATITPTACPAGYACPAGTTSATSFPCPLGRYSSVGSLNSTSQCTVCEAGRFCNGTGLTAPSGLCEPGYHCISGSTSNAPVDGVSGRVCPMGSYCLRGTQTPTACPPGTFLNATGATALTACISCTAGYLCPSAGTVVPTQPCPAGFFCPSGLSAPLFPCPAGFLCRVGFVSPLMCDPGTYQNQTGQSACIQCPRGYFCPLAAVVPSECPRGYYCPPGTQTAVQNPCPASTFNNATRSFDISACIPCLPGMYCAVPGLAAPSGLCGPGHYCTRSAVSAQPTDGLTGGACAPGYVCEYGSDTPTPVIPANRTSAIVGYVCPAGSFCTGGNAKEVGCPPGQFQPSSGSSTCTSCPARHFCPGNTSFPVTCPSRFYCPSGRDAPIACPPGTYGASEGLASDVECTLCPATKYCVDGGIAGDCAAGYICLIANADPMPEPDNGVPSNVGYPCPRGFFCPSGAVAEIPCSNGTFSAVLRASSIHACGSCPPGYTCLDGVPIPIPCSRGFYCPSNGVSISCPMFTYNPNEAAADLSDCMVCPAGYFCNATGIYDLAAFACPVGKFCTIGTREPLPCVAGTYRDSLAATSAGDCHECPGGYYCGTGVTTPRPCNATTFCPNGSVAMTTCPARYYCPSITTTPILCPASHYCEPGTATPVLCPLGTYCEPGSAWPTNCPAGTFAPPDTSNTSRASRAEACITCPPGTYSAGVNGVECLPCPSGYVCLGSTSSPAPLNSTTDSGYPCPAGYYCPEGSSAERPCPPGTFNALDRRGDVKDCLPCFNGTYNHLQGQSSCRPCSSSAYTLEPGATACACRGLYRSFQMSDGFCVCEPGYEFLDEDFTVLSEADGEVDCQPIQFEWCPVGTRRLASGRCAAIDCNTDCSSGRGTFNAQMGICMCDGLTPTNLICDADCRAQMVQVYVDPVTRLITVNDPQSNSTLQLDAKREISGFYGDLQCIPRAQQVAYSGIVNASDDNAAGFAAQSGDRCQVYTVDVSTSGFTGVFEAPSQILQVLAERVGIPQSRRLQRRIAAGRKAIVPANAQSVPRYLQEGAGGALTPAIVRPVTCLELGQTVAFQVSSTTNTYPVYVKDSFLNSNPSFDYGAFRALASLVLTNKTDITLFAFSFTQNGTYVFASSQNANHQIIVRVMGAGQACPVEAAFVPMTADNLVMLAIQETSQPVLEPNWRLLGALLGGLLAIVVVVIGGLYYFRYRAWGDVSGYRRRRHGAVLGESKVAGAKNVHGLHTGDAVAKGISVGRDHTQLAIVEGDGAGAQGGQQLIRRDPDDLDLADLVDKFKDHQDEVQSAFKEQQEITERILQTLKDEAEQLRRLIAASTVDASAAAQSAGTADASSASRRAAILRQVEGEVAARTIHDKSMARREAEILVALQQLAGYLHHDAAGVADETIEQLLAAGGDIEDEDLDVAAYLAATKKVKPEDSESVRELTAQLHAIHEMVSRAINAALDERERRLQGLPLWKTAAASGIVDKKSDVYRVIEQLEQGLEILDAAQTSFLELLRVFTLGTDAFSTSFRSCLGMFIKELVRAREQQNPAVIERVRQTSHAQATTLLDELIRAIDTVLGRLPPIMHKLDIQRGKSLQHLQAGLPQIASFRESAEQAAEVQRISGSGADSLVTLLSKMIEQARQGQFTRTILSAHGTSGESTAPAARFHVDAKDLEDASIPEGHRQAAATMVARVEQEMLHEQATIAAKVDQALARADEQQQHSDEQTRQDTIRNILSDPNLTEAERQRLLKEFEADQMALARALQLEKDRQAAELAQRLDEKKREKLARKLRMAEAKAAAEAERNARAAVEDLVRAQEQERKRQWEALQQDAEKEVQEFNASASNARDTTFNIESQLNKLKEKFEQELSAVATACEVERRRQAALLQSKLRERAEKKLRALRARQVAELAAASTDEEKAQLLQKHVTEVQVMDTQLAEEEQTDVLASTEAGEVIDQRAAAQISDLERQYADDVARLGAAADAEKASKLDVVKRELSAQRSERLREMHAKHAAELSRSDTVESTALLKARHAAELAVLEAELDANDEKELAAVEAAAVAASCALSSADIHAQLARLQRQHQQEIEAAEAARELERSRQAAALQRKLFSRREKRTLQLQRKHAMQLMDQTESSARSVILQTQKLEMETLLADIEKADAEDLQKQVSAEEEVKDDFDARIKAIHEVYERDIASLARAADRERERQKASGAVRLAERRARRERAQKRRHELQLAQADDALTKQALEEVYARESRIMESLEQEANLQVQKEADATAKILSSKLDAEAELLRLRLQHDTEVAALEHSVKSERSRQEAALQQKLAAKRAKKQMELLRQQQMEQEQALAAGVPQVQIGELKRQHAVQIATLEEEIVQEETTEVADLQQALTTAEVQVKSQLRIKNVDLNEAVAKLHEQFFEEKESMLAAVQGEERRQKARLEAKIAQRNARKMRQLAQQQQTALAAMEADAARKMADATTAPDLTADAQAVQQVETAVLRQLETNKATMDAETLQKQAELEVENEKRRHQLKAKQEEEQRRLEADMQAEVEAKALQQEESRRAALEARRRELELKVQAMNLSTGEEVERVRKEHEAELMAYAASTEDERRRQREKLEHQLAARRARKARDLKRKQDEEMAAELARQQAAAAELTAALAAKKEMEAVEMALSAQPNLNSSAAGEAIEGVMQQRHSTETAELLARQYAERAKGLKAALEQLFERKREEQSDLMEALRDAGATNDDIEKALAALQAKYDTEKARTEKAVVEDMEVKHAKEQLELRQRQLAELATAFSKLAPEDVLRRHEAEEAAKEAAQLREFQERMLREKEERLTKIKHEKEAFEVRLRQQNEEEMARLDAEHEAQLEEERRRTEQQLQQRKERLLREQDDLRKKKLEESSGLDMEARDRIMKEFEDNQARMEEKLDAVRSQQQAKLEAKLALRKEKQKRNKERELAEKLREQEAKAADEAASAAEAAAKAAAEAEAKQKAEAAARVTAQTTQMAPAAAAMRAAVEKTAAKAAAIVRNNVENAEALADSEYASGKPSAALEKRLAHVESLLTTVAEHVKFQARVYAKGPAGTIAYIDPTDALQPTEGQLEVVHPAALPSREHLRYDFAIRLLKAVGLSDGPKAISITPARSLPHNEYSNNAFRNSVYFDSGSRSLYIRSSRFQSAGDTMLLIAHACAHIRANGGDMSNDFDARFIGEFHKCVRLCAQELFKQQQLEAKLESDSTGIPTLPRTDTSPPLTTKPSGVKDRWQKGLTKLRSMRAFGMSSHNLLDTAKAAVEVSREVADTETAVEVAATPSLGAWEAGTLPDRLSRLKALARKDFLHKYLHDLEAEIVQLDTEGSLRPQLDDVSALDVRAMNLPLTEAEAATVEAYRNSLQQNITAIQDSLDRGQQLILTRTSQRDEARGRVAELRELLDSKTQLLQRVGRAERRAAAAMDGLLADNEDDDSIDVDEDLDVSTLPPRKDVQRDVDHASQLLKDAEAALKKAEDALGATNVRVQKLREQLRKAQDDLQRIQHAKGGEAWELATAATRAAAVAAQTSLGATPLT